MDDDVHLRWAQTRQRIEIHDYEFLAYRVASIVVRTVAWSLFVLYNTKAAAATANNRSRSKMLQVSLN